MTIFIVGHLCLDSIIINNEQRPLSMGGTASFSSIVCSRFGAPEKVSVISKIGPDFPDEFLSLLSEGNIDINNVQKVKRHSTRYELVYINDTRDLTLKSVCTPITTRDFPKEISNAKLVYFGPIAKEISPETIISAKEQTEGLIALDIQGLIRHRDEDGKLYYKSGLKIDEVLSSVDIVKLDLIEAQVVTGASKIRDIVSYLSRLGVKMALITKSRKGSALYYEGKLVKLPAIILRHIYGATGAGDCFFSSFLIEYLKTKDPLHSAQFATKAVSYLIGSPNGIQSFLTEGNIHNIIEKFIEENRVN
ncbi:MAG: hypothetical protein HWN65_14690 [Candidatus Helarchaeota archaeon]|nr:hypothetical protein [Candidatus Helarchaeota archaeon]